MDVANIEVHSMVVPIFRTLQLCMALKVETIDTNQSPVGNMCIRCSALHDFEFEQGKISAGSLFCSFRGLILKSKTID